MNFISACTAEYNFLQLCKNQQEATFFRLLFFNSALHVSGDKFAHHQEHFLTVYRLYIQSKSAPEDGRICRPKYVGLN